MFMNMEELAQFASENRDMFHKSEQTDTKEAYSLKEFVDAHHIMDEACHVWHQIAEKPEYAHLSNGHGFEVFFNIYSRFRYHSYLCLQHTGAN